MPLAAGRAIGRRAVRAAIRRRAAGAFVALAGRVLLTGRAILRGNAPRGQTQRQRDCHKLLHFHVVPFVLRTRRLVLRGWNPAFLQI